MAGIRNRWLSPVTVAAVLLAFACVGCQIEYRWVDKNGRPVAPPGADAIKGTTPQPASPPADVQPVGYSTRQDETLPPAHPVAPNYSVAPGAPGCGNAGIVGGPVPNLPMPTEKEMEAHHAYIIEPPDTLMIQPVRLIPKPPYRVEPLDVIQIQVAEALPKEPINGPFIVSPEGMVNLGFSYGVVRVGGLTIEQAAQAIKTQLKLSINNPVVSVSLLQFRGVQQTAGEHLVIQDGTITLGSYGSVFVTGMTVCQAKAAIEAHLSQYLLNPEISLSVNAYNSKVFYVINDGAGYGMTVNRFPITGKETVLDAIAINGGLAPVASRRRIWLARPGPPDAPCYKILPVNWDAIVMGGDTSTNWQLFPGDRIYIDSDPFIWINNTMSKVFAPIEQALGIILLGNTTAQSFNSNFFNNNNNGLR